MKDKFFYYKTLNSYFFIYLYFCNNYLIKNLHSLFQKVRKKLFFGMFLWSNLLYFMKQFISNQKYFIK